MIKYVKAVGITDEMFFEGRMPREVCNILSHAKLKHRTSLKLEDWSADNYWRRQSEVLDPTLRVCEETLRKGTPRTWQKYPEFTDTIERVQYKELGEDQFIQKYEFGSRPVIIQGIADNWPGTREW